MNDLIDRQTAIKAIENLQDCYNGFSDTYDKACIIGVLEELPSAQPEITEKQVKEYCEKRCLVVLSSDCFHRLVSKAEEFRWNGGGNY